MSLSPFDSFQSRFVTYLLNFPRNLDTKIRTYCVQKSTFQKWTGKKCFALKLYSDADETASKQPSFIVCKG